MNNKKIRFLLISMLVILIGSNGTWYTYYLYQKHEGKVLYEKIKNNRQVYVYDTFYHTLNPAMYITRKMDYENFVRYNKNREINKKENFIEFPIKNITFYYPFYVIDEHLSDTNLIQVAYVDTSTYEYDKLIVYKGTVYSHPPSDSLLLDYEKFAKSRDIIQVPFWRAH